MKTAVRGALLTDCSFIWVTKHVHEEEKTTRYATKLFITVNAVLTRRAGAFSKCYATPGVEISVLNAQRTQSVPPKFLFHRVQNSGINTYRASDYQRNRRLIILKDQRYSVSEQFLYNDFIKFFDLR